MTTPDILHRRQVVYWRLTSAVLGYTEQAQNFEDMAAQIVDEVGLPPMVLDTKSSIDALLRHYPELEAELNTQAQPDEPETATLRRGLLISKVMINVFGPNTQTQRVSATQYAQWLKDVERLEQAMGCKRGELRKGGSGGYDEEGNQAGSGSGESNQQNQKQGHNGSGGTGEQNGRAEGTEGGSGIGHGFDFSPDEIKQAIASIEDEMIKKMQLRELLADNNLARQIQPSMGILEEILRDKSNLSGIALENARRIVRTFINELAEVLRLQVKQTPSGKIDYSVPPKRVFRNLDLDRTIWKNLINWNPDEQRLYVDRLYFKHTARKRLPTRMIVVVDQSGSMVNAMVQCTILASIFAGLPEVDVHLLAFDTRVIDLTAWIDDPLEVLMRTELGGGTHILYALQQAAEKIIDPRRTALVLITDFYEGGSNQDLLNYIQAIKQGGTHFIPVGSVDSSGYFSVNDWFRTRLKDMGMPILTGSPKKLIAELKKLIVV